MCLHIQTFLYAALFIPVASFATLTTDMLDYNWEASDNATATAASWNSTVGGDRGTWTINSNPGTNKPVNRQTVSSNTRITHAYDFSGFVQGIGSNRDGSANREAFNPGESDIDTPDATFEFWIKPDSLDPGNDGAATTSQMFLFETGGATRGWGLTLWDNELRASIKNAGGNGDPPANRVISHSLSPSDISDFVQVVVTFDDLTKDFSLYVNPVNAASPATPVATSNWISDNWQGTSDSSLGGLMDFSESNGFGAGATESADLWSPSNFIGYEGQIAIARVYDDVLSPSEIADNFYAVIPEPQSFGLLLLGLILVARNRRR